VSTIGWGLTTPFRAVNWAVGRSSFSRDWETFQRSNFTFQESGRQWMQRLLPGDSRNATYRTFRSGVSSGMEWGAFALGGVGIAKGAYSLVQKGSTAARKFAGMQKIGRPAAAITSEEFKLTRFHQAARNLSETGQNNIRILRGWAKSKGLEKLSNPQGGPESWGIYKNAKFEWRLRIKPEASSREGLHQGSAIPRFDARILSDLKGQSYINPFSGEMGNWKIGTHLPLECEY